MAKNEKQFQPSKSLKISCFIRAVWNSDYRKLETFKQISLISVVFSDGSDVIVDF